MQPRNRRSLRVAGLEAKISLLLCSICRAPCIAEMLDDSCSRCLALPLHCQKPTLRLETFPWQLWMPFKLSKRVSRLLFFRSSHSPSSPQIRSFKRTLYHHRGRWMFQKCFKSLLLPFVETNSAGFSPLFQQYGASLGALGVFLVHSSANDESTTEIVFLLLRHGIFTTTHLRKYGGHHTWPTKTANRAKCSA